MDALGPIRDLYAYHWWANRVVSGLGEGVCRREVGEPFSFPTLKGMRLHGDADFTTPADLRLRWDELEKTQRTFLERLTPSELSRPVEYTSTLIKDRRLTLPLGGLLQHVANHATHHRSELATMITMLSGSPPGTDFVVYQLITSGQIPPEHAGWR